MNVSFSFSSVAHAANVAAAVVSAFLLAATMGRANAQSSRFAGPPFLAPSVLQAEMTLLTPATVVQGEPILVHYRLSNLTTNRSVQTDRGIYGNRWYRLVMTDTTGKESAALPDRRPARPRGAFAAPNGFMNPKMSQEGDIVVTRACDIDHPGTYQLTVRMNLAFATALPGQDEVAMELLTTNPQYFKKDFTFTITVLEPNVSFLQRKAASLQHQVVSEPDPESRKRLAEQLFSLPERSAISCWRAIAFDPNADRVLVARELSHSRSLQAAELLARMEAMYPVIDTQTQSRFSTLPLLQEMSDQGDETMKAQVVALKKRYHLDGKPAPGVTD